MVRPTFGLGLLHGAKVGGSDTTRPLPKKVRAWRPPSNVRAHADNPACGAIPKSNRADFFDGETCTLRNICIVFQELTSLHHDQGLRGLSPLSSQPHRDLCFVHFQRCEKGVVTSFVDTVFLLPAGHTSACASILLDFQFTNSGTHIYPFVQWSCSPLLLSRVQ